MRIDDEILANYYVSRAAFLRGDIEEAEKYYRANRLLGTDLYYEVDLPPKMLLQHPIGTVLGRANYGNYLVAYQGSGVGSDVDGNRPTLGEGVVLFPGARVLGNVKVGNNVWITANTVVQGVAVPDNSVVFMGPVTVWYGARGPGYTHVTAAWRPTRRSVKKQFFGVD